MPDHILEPGLFSTLERVPDIPPSRWPLLRERHATPWLVGLCAIAHTFTCPRGKPMVPWEGGLPSAYTAHIAPVHSLTYALRTVPRRNEKERGQVFGEMIKPEIDVWVRPRPDHQELVRNASALAAELMGRGKKKEREKWAVDATPSLSRFVCETFLFRLGLCKASLLSPRTARARCRGASVSPICSSPYATIIIRGANRLVACSIFHAFSTGRQHNIPRTLSSAMDGKLMTVVTVM